MYSVAVKDHIMIAHGLRGEVFGPAQRLHGATFVITSEYKSRELNESGIVVDIGEAQRVLSEVLETIRFRNLDDMPEFAGKNTTTEFLAAWIHGRLAERMHERFAGTLRIVLEESHVAWGSYEAAVGVPDA